MKKLILAVIILASLSHSVQARGYDRGHDYYGHERSLGLALGILGGVALGEAIANQYYYAPQTQYYAPATVYVQPTYTQQCMYVTQQVVVNCYAQYAYRLACQQPNGMWIMQ